MGVELVHERRALSAMDSPDRRRMIGSVNDLILEIASDVADSSRSLILDQVKYGVAVRMAVLYLATGGSAAETRT